MSPAAARIVIIISAAGALVTAAAGAPIYRWELLTAYSAIIILAVISALEDRI